MVSNTCECANPGVISKDVMRCAIPIIHRTHQKCALAIFTYLVVIRIGIE